MRRASGKFIVIEGLDGSGQTTQARLLVKWLVETLRQRAIYTKEPTDGPVGTIVRRALSTRGSRGRTRERTQLHPLTLALCFAADRMDHVHTVIAPMLEDGVHVVSDRYVLSSLAYQSSGADMAWIREINRQAIRPDLTLFLGVAPSVYPAEIVPLTNPYTLKPGSELRVRCLVDGKSVANQIVLLGGEGVGGPIAPRSVRTNAEGIASVTLDAAGKWYVKFVHMVPLTEPDFDYESKWATLTFEIQR